MKCDILETDIVIQCHLDNVNRPVFNVNIVNDDGVFVEAVAGPYYEVMDAFYILTLVRREFVRGACSTPG